MKSFKIYTLGCKVNQYDSGRLAGYLEELGLEPVKSEADLVIINTCSVTKATGAKNSRTIALARKQNPNARVVVCGCWVRIYPEDQRNFQADLVVANKNPEIVAAEIADFFKLELPPFCSHLELVYQDRARYTIKVQDGCRQFCSYCVIPYSRGVLWSRNIDEVLAEAQKAIQAGYPEIILTGIHLGLYGRDASGKQIENDNLVSLLQKLLNLGGKVKYRLSSIEITEVSDELIALFAQEQRLCKHLHISLQSGCDKTLRAMNRPYTCEEYGVVVEKIRKQMPDFAITTDIIVGFPGESDDDFAKTMDFARKINFSKIHVFSFSAHPKAPAYNLPDKVSSELIKERSAKLRQLSDELESNYIDKFKGQELEFLIIGQRKGIYICKNEYFFDKQVSVIELEQKLNSRKIIGQRVKLEV